MERTFISEIIESSRELTKREALMMKDTTNALKLDKATNDGAEVAITPVAYAVLKIHNEASKDRKDYENYVIIDENGDKYVTGSPSFWRNFMDIWEEMAGEPFSITCFKKDSKNYIDKQFLTCSIV